MRLIIFIVFTVLFLSFKGNEIFHPETFVNQKVKITQKSMIGDWKTGEGIRYNLSNGKVISEQPLQAQYYLMSYKSDSTMWHDGHKAILTWKVVPGNKIVYDYNTSQERYYKVEEYTKTKMQVFGPFTRDGKRYDPTALFRLVQYREQRPNK